MHGFLWKGACFVKIWIDKKTFLKSWGMAERCAGAPGHLDILAGVYVGAGPGGVEMRSTNLRVSLACQATGVETVEPGAAVLPVKGVSELFGKAGSDEFTLEVADGKATMVSGKSRYRFSTYPCGDFPKTPTSAGASPFCSIKAGSLALASERGGICAEPKDAYPQYLSSVYFDLVSAGLNVASTDKKRLALYKADAESAGNDGAVLLPLHGVREMLRLVGALSPDAEVKIALDGAQAYFITPAAELAVRCVESKFPNYSKIMPKSANTAASVDRAELIAALERIDIAVRDENRTVVVELGNDGNCALSGKSRQFGEASETLPCEQAGGSLKASFSARFFLDAVKASEGPSVRLAWETPDGHMAVSPNGSDIFTCLIAPVEPGKEMESEGAGA
jgi:DNA polymerase-3 subunit beta